ncbi:VanW family protein, partial [Pseudonocardia pini]|uniref:VanW family protein n=1 Tax=Pseudonocardia pini TaxID=2758030 RepID=UPI001C68EF40
GAPTGDIPKRGRKRPLLIVAGLVAVLAILYVADLVLSAGNVPRGVTVAGLELGGLSKAEARQRLQTEIEPRSSLPVQVTAGEVQSQIDPKAAGLEVDYQTTIDQAGAQPLNPVTRVTSFFTTREVGVVNTADERSVLTALEQVKPVVDKAPVEGTVRFDGTTPVGVPPVPGQELDLRTAVGVLERDWASGSPVALPLITQPTITTDQDVQEAVQQVATPAVSAPVTLQGEGATATLTPANIAAALTFRADAAASPKLVPEINNEALKEVATPQLASTEKPGRDATLDFSTGAPVVVPSQDGRGVDYDKTFEGLVPVLTGSGTRTLTAVYADQPAKLTTEQLNALGITGEISTFTTGGFAADSGRNIRRAAEQVNGTIVEPGETFSLNALTNPRNAANGYVEAGIIENGHSARGVGGGVSQVATTLYNAAYFAGMVDVEHKEHSFYIGRYPVAREATVFDDIIDLKFRNDGPTGVLIQTIWTPSNLTVKMFGTKRYEVTSETGPRTNPTEPQTLTLPAGPSCVAGRGSPGFTATDTRVMRNVETGEVTRKTRTVRYNPVPTVVCQ